MNEGDVIALATFLVSHENLIVNKAILEDNIARHIDNVAAMNKQARLLEKIITLLEGKNERTV